MSKLNMVEPCAYLSIENDNVRCSIPNHELQKKKEKNRKLSSKGWENTISISKS